MQQLPNANAHFKGRIVANSGGRTKLVTFHNNLIRFERVKKANVVQ